MEGQGQAAFPSAPIGGAISGGGGGRSAASPIRGAAPEGGAGCPAATSIGGAAPGMGFGPSGFLSIPIIRGLSPTWVLLVNSLTRLSATRSGSKSRKLMTGTPRKKGHPTSEVLAPAEVESEVVVKVGRAGGMV